MTRRTGTSVSSLTWVIGPVETLLVIFSLTALPLGHLQVSRTLLFLLLGWLASKGLRRAIHRPNSSTLALLATLTIGYALVVWTQLASSWIGILDAGSQWLLWSALGILGVAAGSRASSGVETDSPEIPTTPWATIAAGAVVLPASLFAIAYILVGWEYPPIEWDALSYHLYFPIQWVQAGRIDYIPTPFGPEYFTYFPGNYECFVTWLLWANPSDWPAKSATALFVGWVAVGIWSWTRLVTDESESTTTASAAWSSALSVAVLLCTPSIYSAAKGTMNDLAGAACSATSLCFLVAGRRSSIRRERFVSFGLAGLAAGLMIGTKATNVIYLPLLLLGLFAILLPRPSKPQPTGIGNATLMTLPFFAMTTLGGGYWFARNLIETGNPVYPLNVDLGGWTIFRGPLDRGTMYEGGWSVEETGLTGLWETASRYFQQSPLGERLLSPGWTASLWPVLIALGVVLTTTLFLRRPWRLLPWSALGLPIAGMLLFWILIPHTTEFRLAAPAAVLLFAWVGLLPTLLPGRWSMLGWIVSAGIAGGWFALNAGILRVLQDGSSSTAIDSVLLAIVMGALLLVLLCWQIFGAWPGRPIVSLLGGVLLAIALAVVNAFTHAPTLWLDRQQQFLHLGQPANTPWMQAWFVGQRLVAQLTQDQPSTIAYVGFNSPYGLFGDRLANRVVYIAPSPTQGWFLHQHVEHHGPEATARTRVRDRFPIYRADRDRDDWRTNLERIGVDYLFLTTVHPNERHAFAGEMDPNGFSIERRWADELAYPLLAHGPNFRLYQVTPRSRSTR
ncbi:hypothetical protein [Planctomycetes bacterium Pan216]|uniref:hypothetical protein n=1 Tax=Kolteria novifilia TaxID=2527975 RepID=UPI0011A2B362